MNKVLKKELKTGKLEKRRCAKQYPDWKDDEFNCGPLKYIWGVSDAKNPSFCTVNDMDIYYNRDNGLYFLDLDKTKEYPNTDSYLRYLEIIYDDFHKYMDGKVDNSNPYKIDYSNLFSGNSLTELYYKYKVYVNGIKNL